MASETDQLEADLRTAYKRLFPLRDSANKSFSDEILTLGMLIRAQLSRAGIPWHCPNRYAEGSGYGATAKSKRKGKRAE